MRGALLWNMGEYSRARARGSFSWRLWGAWAESEDEDGDQKCSDAAEKIDLGEMAFRDGAADMAVTEPCEILGWTVVDRGIVMGKVTCGVDCDLSFGFEMS